MAAYSDSFAKDLARRRLPLKPTPRVNPREVKSHHRRFPTKKPDAPKPAATPRHVVIYTP